MSILQTVYKRKNSALLQQFSYIQYVKWIFSMMCCFYNIKNVKISEKAYFLCIIFTTMLTKAKIIKNIIRCLNKKWPTFF